MTTTTQCQPSFFPRTSRARRKRTLDRFLIKRHAKDVSTCVMCTPCDSSDRKESEREGRDVRLAARRANNRPCANRRAAPADFSDQRKISSIVIELSCPGTTIASADGDNTAIPAALCKYTESGVTLCFFFSFVDISFCGCCRSAPRLRCHDNSRGCGSR